MANIFRADCGFNPENSKRFKSITAEEISAVEGMDLNGFTNMTADLSGETGDVTISKFVNMVNGKQYMIVATNGGSTQNGIVFPEGTLTYGTVTKANGMTVVYTFFTTGETVYCNQAIYAAV